MVGVNLIALVLTATYYIDPSLAQCEGQMDISIAIPGSYSVPPSEFTVFENCLIDLFRHFHIDPEHVNIGLVLYGEQAVNIAFPQPFKTRTQMNTRATLLTQRRNHYISLGVDNKVAEAIKAVRNQLLLPPPEYGPQILRPEARKMGVIFTYGPSADADINLVNAEAEFAKSRGILMYALGANGTGPEFPTIGTDYCRLFSMGKFETGLVSAVPDLASAICSEIDPLVTIASGNCHPNRYGVAAEHPVTCQVKNNMVQADPNNCAYFYRCDYFDTPPQRFSCGPGTIYDPLTLGCNLPSNVACYADLKCPPGPPGLYPYGLDCSKFLNCDVAHVPRVQSCAPGLLFDEFYSACNETIYVDCFQQ